MPLACAAQAVMHALPQRLIEVLNQIICVFQTDGEPQQTFG
jgi:hypothetical protein